MNLPPSRLLTRLNTDIAAERNPFRADLLRAERAAYLARQGQLEEAKSDLAELHLRYDSRPNIEMSAWVSLAESLVSFLSDMGPGAMDKMRRARALSQAAGFARIHSLSSAWLAHYEYTTFDLELMAQHLAESLRLAPPDFHTARSRANLVVGQALHLAGQMELAAPWYKRARDHAVAEGDEATTSALMHNMSWLRMHAHRQEVLTGAMAGLAGSHARIGLESTVQYDHLQGLSGLDPLKPILLAQIFALEGKAAESLALFDEYLSTQPGGVSRLQCSWLADRAWCLVELGQDDEARTAVREVEVNIQADTQIDDRAATHSRLAQVFTKLGNAAEAERHLGLADSAWQEFAQLQDKICQLLRDLPESGAMQSTPSLS
jgi:tetratricopeptide (TPR) repeat protein